MVARRTSPNLKRRRLRYALESPLNATYLTDDNALRPQVTSITPARENYHCGVLSEAENEERHYVYAVPTEVGL